MGEIHVPFLKGLHEETDKRLLPDGHLTRAENVRFQKEGRVVSRNGYAFIDDSPADDNIAAVNFETSRTLHFGRRSAGAGTGAQWWQRKPDGTFTTPAYASCISSIESPKRTVATPTIRYNVLASDMAKVGAYLFVVYNDADSNDDTRGGLFYALYERQTMQQVVSGEIVSYGAASSAYMNPRCIAVDDVAYVFYMLDDNLLMWKFDASTMLEAAVTLSPAISFAAPVPGHHTSFDVCMWDADEFALCVEYVIATVSTGIAVYRVTTAGAVTLPFTDTTYGSEPKQVGIAQASSTTFGIAAVTDGNVKWGLFTNAGVTLTPVSNIDASGDAVGAPCTASVSTHGVMVAWGRQGSPAGQMGVWGSSAWSGTVAKYVQALFPVSRPFVSGESAAYVWAVDQTHDPNDDPDNQAGGFATYRLVDIGSLDLFDPNAGETISEAVCAQEEALAGNWYYGEQYEQRRGSVVFDEDDINGNTVSTSITALPMMVGVSSFTAGRVDFVEFRSGAYTEKLFSAKLNGQLFLSGPRMREFDGSQLYESGLFQGPSEFTVEEVGGDVELLGTFQYCCLWKWIDAGGRVHRSQVSPIRSADGGGESTGFQITIAPPPFSDRIANGTTTIFAEVYRTLSDQSTFHLINPDERYVYSPNLTSPIQILDENTDDDIEDNEVVYTQIGNTLDNQEPPACKYIWAGEDRLLMGGLEDPSMYEFSKKSRPGLAVAFCHDEAFRGTIEGDVAGVAQLDGTWFVGSRENIWAIVGQGPDDSGAGEFSPPRKLPSDTGFTSFRSILEVPQGLLFQGKGNRIFLLPRGGSAPVWIGRAVQDTLDTYPFITCATYLAEENIAVFACRLFADGDDDNDGRLLVFDTDIGEWVTDKPFVLNDSEDRIFTTLTTWSGKLLLDGRIEETATWTDDLDGSSPTWIVGTLETGDVRFFGANGYGRCREAMILGESLSDFVNVSLEVSRDSGASYDSPAASFSPTTLEQVSYRLPYVRGGSFRFRLTVTPCDELGVPAVGEGAALNALSCEVFRAPGLAKLRAEKRA